MGDTPIAGADEAIGTPGTQPGAADNTDGTVQDLLDTPVMPLQTASFDDFKRAMSDSAITPNGFSSSLLNGDGTTNATGTRGALVKYAKQFLGTPYVWGGSSPGGFDCSGLVQYVAKKFGLNLPRISNQQANSGVRTDIKNLQAGDLVAWDENSRNQGADHIAFYIGNGYVLEAPHTGADVRIRKLGKNEGAYGVHVTYPG
jgi:cell wall-associated NlpC family hydrolase